MAPVQIRNALRPILLFDAAACVGMGAGLVVLSDPLAGLLAQKVPRAELESHGIWVARLAALARSVEGMAFAVLALVAGVSAAVVAVATRVALMWQAPGTAVEVES